MPCGGVACDQRPLCVRAAARHTRLTGSLRRPCRPPDRRRSVSKTARCGARMVRTKSWSVLLVRGHSSDRRCHCRCRGVRCHGQRAVADRRATPHRRGDQQCGELVAPALMAAPSGRPFEPCRPRRKTPSGSGVGLLGRCADSGAGRGRAGNGCHHSTAIRTVLFDVMHRVSIHKCCWVCAGDYLWMYPAALVSMTFIVLVACIHHHAKDDLKLFSLVALCFASLGAALTLAGLRHSNRRRPARFCLTDR